MSKGTKRPDAVIAIMKDDAAYRAVELRRHDRDVEVLWARTEPAAERSWADFAAECGLPVDRDGRDRRRGGHATPVVGLDSTPVAFYRISTPTVGERETAAIVRMQAESLLPLRADQIEVAWRSQPSTNGKMEVTIAAARRDYLQRFAASVQGLEPQQVLLSCEGTARAWRRLFSEGERHAVVVSFGRENTQACMVHDDQVTHAAVLDTGLEALASLVESEASGEAAERFAQDMRTILDSFGWEASSQWPVILLSDGDRAIERIADALNAAGLPAKIAMADAAKLRMAPSLGVGDLYEYRTCLGLGLIAMEVPDGALDLFGGMRAADERKEVTSSRRSVVVAGVLAVAMLIVLLVVWRSVDVARADRLGTRVADPNIQAFEARQALLKTVARHRPDVLQLLADVNGGPSDGIVLDDLHFKKGQAVTIAGQAGNVEQMWKYQAGLMEHDDVGPVEITRQTADPKTKKIAFTMTFPYKGFSKREAAL